MHSPFLFAVMFGDIGHGILMALAATAFILIEKKYPRGFGEEITDTFFFGRYIILLMGLFAVVSLLHACLLCSRKGDRTVHRLYLQRHLFPQFKNLCIWLGFP
jgi:vacuolar-type H+-ATPase subunit I/STV1